MITNFDIEKWFTYHAPAGGQVDRIKLIRNKARELADVIVDYTPACADQTAAIRKLREVVMNANAAIVCEE